MSLFPPSNMFHNEECCQDQEVNGLFANWKKEPEKLYAFSHQPTSQCISNFCIFCNQTRAITMINNFNCFPADRWININKIKNYIQITLV